MASRNFSRIQGLNKELKILAGRFTDSAKQAGLGWTVSGTATGQYTIALVDRYPYLVSMTATVQAATGEDMKVIIVSHDVDSATPTIVLEVQDAGVAADLAGDEEIHFHLVLQNSTLPVL